MAANPHILVGHIIYLDVDDLFRDFEHSGWLTAAWSPDPKHSPVSDAIDLKRKGEKPCVLMRFCPRLLYRRIGKHVLSVYYIDTSSSLLLKKSLQIFAK